MEDTLTDQDGNVIRFEDIDLVAKPNEGTVEVTLKTGERVFGSHPNDYDRFAAYQARLKKES